MNQSHQQDELLIQRYERIRNSFLIRVSADVQRLEHICVQARSHDSNQIDHLPGLEDAVIQT